MNDTSHDTAPEETAPSSWLSAEIDGRPVHFWIAAAAAIALVILAFGAWWVWGLDQDMPGDDTPMTGATPTQVLALGRVEG